MTAAPLDPSASATKAKSAPADDQSRALSIREPAKHRWAEPIAALRMVPATLGTHARSAGNFSGAYQVNAVLFATVLVFASAAIKFEQPLVGLISFVFALAVFASALPRVALLPL